MPIFDHNLSPEETQSAKCPECGETFLKKARQQKYCLPRCRMKAGNRKAAKKKKIKTEKIEFIECAYSECDVVFKKRDGRQKYCSTKCKEKVRSGKNRERYRGKSQRRGTIPAYFLKRHATEPERTEAKKFLKETE